VTVAAIALPPLGVSVKLELVSVLAVIARENVAVTSEEAGTPVAPAAGAFAVTVGGFAFVVNDQVNAAASATPSADLTVVSSFAVYVVLPTRLAEGVSVAVFEGESYVTVAATADPPDGVSVKLELVIVVGSIAREKVAVGAIVSATPVAPLAGVFAVTVGATLTVVNDQEYGLARAIPSADLTVVASVAV